MCSDKHYEAAVHASALWLQCSDSGWPLVRTFWAIALLCLAVGCGRRATERSRPSLDVHRWEVLTNTRFEGAYLVEHGSGARTDFDGVSNPQFRRILKSLASTTIRPLSDPFTARYSLGYQAGGDLVDIGVAIHGDVLYFMWAGSWYAGGDPSVFLELVRTARE